MKILLSHLKDFFTTELSAEEICETLTAGGIEVEGITRFGREFEGVVVAEVRKTSPHPDAEKLTIATVFDGTEELQIVCGASNCRKGLKTALVKIGGFLTDEEGKKWKIKKSKLRGVESSGMLCAETEIGISDRDDGIMECDQLEVGTPLKELYSDFVLEISLTPNLGHCLSALGLARELSALAQIPYHLPPMDVEEKGPAINYPISIKEPELCTRYSARIIRGVKVGPSPDWVKKRLEGAGISPINNLVDLANYVMLELGHPMHIFDLDKLKGPISVEKRKRGTFTGLDDKEHSLKGETLVIAEGEKILALAGVLGGKETAVSENTQNILIEAAHFNPSIVRKMGKELSIRTDSAYRFERGVDHNNTLSALNRVSHLITQIAGGEVDKGIIDIEPAPYSPTEISCRPKRANTLLGTDLASNEMLSIFQRLEIEPVSEEDPLVVRVPSYRNDLKEEIDLIEEIGRVYGLHNIPTPPPRHVSSPISSAPIFLFENRVKEILLREGLQEWITCDLISPELAKIREESPSLRQIPVLHPSSVDQSILRSSLLPGLLQSLKKCNDHKRYDIAAFEVGRIHFQAEEQYKEHLTASILLSGKSRPYHWDPKPNEWDFFDLKGIAENFFSALGIENVSFVPSNYEHFHPFAQVSVHVGDLDVGVLGEIHPKTRLLLDLDRKVYCAEINLHDLFPLAQKLPQFTALAAYPSSERDWTLTIDDQLPLDDLLKIIEKFSPPLLTDVFLLDLYKSDEIGKDRKNITLRFVYRDQNKTIELKTVEKFHEKLVAKVTEELGGKIFI